MVPTAEPGEVSSSPAAIVLPPSAACVAWLSPDLRQPKVQNLQLPALRQKQVCRLDVAMHNALCVGRLQRIGHLDCQRQNRLHVHRLPLQPFPQRLSHQKLHHDEVLQLVPLDCVDGADVRVIQRGCRPRFALKTLQ